VDECEPLMIGPAATQRSVLFVLLVYVAGRGLHSFRLQLKLSALYGIGDARRGCIALVKGVSGGVHGVQDVLRV
jgi:hypothetical protein